MVLGGNDQNPTINNQSMTSMADMMNMANVMTVKLGTTEVWTLINRSGDTHAFHVHDIQFQILDRDGATPAANEAGLKDTVMVRSRETVRIIMRFTDFADPTTPYMYHCHLLTHEDNGMMGQFVVVSE
jgi:bilirubin oxidase